MNGLGGTRMPLKKVGAFEKMASRCEKKSEAVPSFDYRGTFARARSESIIRKYKEAPIKESAA